MNFLIIIGTAILLSASIFGYTSHATKDPLPKETEPTVQSQQSVAEAETNIVRKLVEDFGKKLQMVSLSAAPELASQSIKENYSALITPDLLSKWQRNPGKALGRTVSSPWPDRIEIMALTKVADSVYQINGRIVEITSVEKTKGGSAATRPVTLTVKKINNHWLIDEATAGAYDAPQTVYYQNTQYGFGFSLPSSWRGYTIVTDQWVGNTVGDATGSVQAVTGPLLSIRHPQWTAQNPRQDIPIMILTIAQWNDLQQEKFHIGAAPIGPRELGRTQTYVFALPARYNFAFPLGFEEVETILNGNPLTILK